MFKPTKENVKKKSLRNKRKTLCVLFSVRDAVCMFQFKLNRRLALPRCYCVSLVGFSTIIGYCVHTGL